MNISKDGIAPNSGRLLWAGSMAILAAGIGFGVRGGILSDWGRDFGYVAQQLGAIAGAGLTGFCFGIIIGGMVCDRLGYGKLIAAAFLTHILSACVTLAADPSQGDAAAGGEQLFDQLAEGLVKLGCLAENGITLLLEDSSALIDNVVRFRTHGNEG